MLDWHQDLVWPTETERMWLDDLDADNNLLVSLHAWARLSPLNDCQIMAAAYLNRIGNIYVHCRQGSTEDRWEPQAYTDKFGHKHKVVKFRSYEELEAYLLQTEEQHVYFDLDLDFFVLDNPYSGRAKKFTYLKDKEIRKMLSVERPFVQWVFERLEGITIALEPEHTGSIKKAFKYLNLLDRMWFLPSLFTKNPGNWKKETYWRHLKIR